jgi:hypothetical protein
VNVVETYEDSIVIAMPRRRWLKRVGCGLLVLVVPALILLTNALPNYVWRHHEVQQRLDEALASLDRNDPGWRLEDIEAAREQLSEEENSASVVVAAARLLPRDWPSKEFEDRFAHLSPEELLSADDSARLKQQLDKVQPALDEAHKLAQLPRGRHRIKYERNILTTRLPGQGEVLRVAQLLVCDAVRHEQEGDLKRAMLACRAAFNAGRSIGDEPFAVSQLFRIHATFSACQGVERVLAQGQPPSEELAAFQRLLADEDAFPELLVSARGERAALSGLMDAIESGDISLSDMSGGRPDWSERLVGFQYRDNIRDEHPLMLAVLSRWVALARLPAYEQPAAELQLQRMIDNLPENTNMTRTMLPVLINKMGTVSRRNQGYLRCLYVALAAECYRRDKHEWPDTFDQLCPKYLPEIPLDPFDGLLLRYLRWKDGVLVYCVGQDARDNGGNLDPENRDQPGADIGIRLWDAAKRRQPPRPKPREKELPR